MHGHEAHEFVPGLHLALDRLVVRIPDEKSCGHPPFDDVLGKQRFAQWLHSVL